MRARVLDDVAFSSALAKHAERATLERTPLALITVSLDDLARVERASSSRTPGIDDGKVEDYLLLQLARLCEGALDGALVVARLGNTRIGVLLDAHIDSARAAADTVRRLVAKTPFDVDRSAVAMTASIGLAMFTVKDGAAALVRASCAAMQDASKRGGNRVA